MVQFVTAVNCPSHRCQNFAAANYLSPQTTANDGSVFVAMKMKRRRQVSKLIKSRKQKKPGGWTESNRRPLAP
jgi:hypothetical protein